MNIAQIVSELKFIESSSLIMCKIEKADLESRVGCIGQLQTHVPGAVLGEREPYLREKNVGVLREELATFGSEFQNNSFLLQYAFEVDDRNYELRYFELSHIEVSEGQPILVSTGEELLELREHHEEPELE
ncbi:MAG: hypothetical protein V7785_16540 [Bermanella sp.]